MLQKVVPQSLNKLTEKLTELKFITFYVNIVGMCIPHFDTRGLLPPGDYPVTFFQLRDSPLVHNHIDGWDKDWRLNLVNQAEILAKQLWEVGIEEIVLDGSFVEDKVHPNDIDGYFTCDVTELGSITQRLNALDPYKVWTWDPSARRPYRGHIKKQLPMWHRYRVELFPHYSQLSGIADKYGQPLTFPSAFRLQRDTYEQKGVVRLLKEGGPR